MKKLIPSLLSLLLLTLVSQINLHGQGAWVEQATGTEPPENAFLEAGDDCVGYAKDNSPFVRFFDVNVHKWITVDLLTPQDFKGMKANSNIIIAYTGEYLIGYSSLTSTFDTLQYAGTPLFPDSNEPEYSSFGTIENAGYFVTYTYFYIFDGELGKWQVYQYFGYPYDDGKVTFLRGMDYIGMIIPKHDEPEKINATTAYSLPQHAFAQREVPGDLNYRYLSHGFVTWRFTGDDNNSFNGYCSASNFYSHQTFDPENYNLKEGLWAFPEETKEKNIMTFVTAKAEPNEFTRLNFYAFNSLNGSWSINYDAYHFKSSEESGFLFFMQGTSMAAASSMKWEDNKVNYYSYEYGSFKQLSVEMTGGGGLAAPVCANNIMMAFDSTKLWMYNPYLSGAYFAPGFFDVNTYYIIGDRFIAVNMWNLSGNTSHDKFHIYNTKKNKAIVVELNAHHSSVYPIVSQNMFAFIPPGSGKSEVYFYSGLIDSLSQVTFNMGNQAYYLEVKDRIGVAFSTNGTETFLYDANTNSRTLLTTPFSSYLIGGNFFMYKTDGTMHAYNFTKQEFSEIQLDNMGNFWAGDTIGLVTDSRKKNFYAYNGFNDKWIPLEPEGTWFYGNDAFGKTAVVVRNDRIYAFDPFLATGIDETSNRQDDNSFQLMQNRPNPFTGTTAISYSLTKAGQVTLKVYDLYGKQVALLVDEYRQPGDYQVSFAPVALPDGIYYYTLTFNNAAKIKKMVVVR